MSSSGLSVSQSTKIQRQPKTREFRMTISDVSTASTTITTSWKPTKSVLVGIIGGIGPAASARLYQYVVELKSASSDSDHVPVLMYSNPQIPNNNAAVTGQGPSSIPAMVYTAKALEKAGATHIAIPCNTAHVFVEQVQRLIGSHLSIINMLYLTALNVNNAIQTKCSSKLKTSFHRVGLMGTIGTIQSRVYQQAFERVAGHGIQVVCPTDATQRQIQDCIGRIKAGEHRQTDVTQTLLQAARTLIDRHDAELIILGCTEIPLCLTPEVVKELDVVVVDPMKVLALEIIRMTDLET